MRISKCPEMWFSRAFDEARLLVGKLDECSDKLGPIVGNQGEASDRQATIRSQSGLSLTGDGNLYCSFLLKSSLLSCKTSSSGNLSEPSSTKNLGEYSDTKAVQAHFCPNIEPIYQKGRHDSEQRIRTNIHIGAKESW